MRYHMNMVRNKNTVDSFNFMGTMFVNCQSVKDGDMILLICFLHCIIKITIDCFIIHIRIVYSWVRGTLEINKTN